MFLKCYILGKHLSWQADTLASATRVDCITEKRYVVFTPDQLDKEEDISLIGLDTNMQMSFVAGIFDNLRGPTINYLANVPDPEQASCTIICQAVSREEHLDLRVLPYYHQSQSTEATHVISRVFYGVEVYCILTIDKNEEGDQKTSVEKLSKLARKLVEGLRLFETLADVKKRLSQEENQFIAHVNCRLFIDLQPAPFIDCSFFDGYHQMLQMLKHVLTVPPRIAAVPIVAELCHLSVFVEQEAEKICPHRIIGADVVARWRHLSFELKRFISLAEKMRSTKEGSLCRESFLKFIRVVITYQEQLEEKAMKILKYRFRNKDWINWSTKEAEQSQSFRSE